MGWIATIVRQGVGAVQMGMATEELKNLPGSREYSLNQDLATATALARKGAQQGMTPEERAVAGQAIGTQQSRTQRAMEQRGLGSLAAAITQSNSTNAFNELEAQNQSIKRDYLRGYADLGSKVQALENANVTSFNQQLAMQQRELGMAAQQGFAGLAGSGAQIAGMLGDNAETWMEKYKESRAAKRADSEFKASGDKLASWAPEGTTSGVDAEGNPISISPDYDPSVDGPIGGFETGLGSSPEGTMTGELGTPFDTELNYSGLDTIDTSSMDVGSMDVGSMDVGSVGGTSTGGSTP